MLLCKYRALMGVLFLVRTVCAIRRCGLEICRDDQACCAQGNDTSAATCCRQLVDRTYYNIAMVTRKLSGVLIMLLLFAVGYFVQRALCSRSRRLATARGGHPVVATSQEPLVDRGTPEGATDPAPAARLPPYEECKLPTYEETVRDGTRGRPEPNIGQTT